MLHLWWKQNWLERFPFSFRFPNMKSKFTAVLRREEDEYMALNPELDIASQGPTPEQALASLREAVGLFLECASANEIDGRLSGEAWITQFEAEYAQA
jgi:predicted RNase H-like HicB family nuclease